MNTLELKGGIYDLISTVNDESVLRQLHEMVQDVLEQNMDKTDFWDELTEDQQKAIDTAVEESYDEKNWIPHEEIVKKHQAYREGLEAVKRGEGKSLEEMKAKYGL